MRRSALFALCLLAGPASFAADETPKPAAMQTVKLRVTGLFVPERSDDLKKALSELPEITLLDIDSQTAEATFRFNAAQAFPGAKPEQIVEQFDNRLRSVSRHTLGVRALCPIPREKLDYVEIPIVGLDCKGCCFGAYDAIYRIEGVEQATADFKKGLVTAWIDPAKVDPAKIEAALRGRGVTLKKP